VSIFSQEWIKAVVSVLYDGIVLAYLQIWVSQKIVQEKDHDDQEDNDSTSTSWHGCNLCLASVV